MQNLERSNFDELWKEAFEGAEVSPSELVWTEVSQQLSHESMKKRVVYYQRLAAACLVLGLLGGLFGIYHWNSQIEGSRSSTENNLSASKRVQQKTETTPSSTNSQKPVEKTEKFISSTKDKIKSDQNNPSNEFADSLRIENYQTKNPLAAAQPISTEGVELISTIPAQTTTQNKNANAFSVNLDLPQPELLPEAEVTGEPKYAEIVRKLPAIPSAFMEERKEVFNHERMWAAVTAAAGSYSVYNGASPYSNVASNAQSSASTPAGSSYIVGMLGGVRVSHRWVIQSGVQYMNQSTGYTSNINSPSLANVASIAKSPAAYASAGSPYSITSTNEFVSLPVQAGYLLVDKKIGWQINPGVAADFFVRNTLVDPTGQRQSYSQGAGTDSPYRSVNFAGLMNSEVSYKLNKNYRVSLVPGFRYSLNPVLKNQSGNPFVWDVGFRFRYIFR